MTGLPQTLKFTDILHSPHVPRTSLPVFYFGSVGGLLMRRLSLAIVAAVSTVALAQIASAADLPRKAPAVAPPPPPPPSWTGFYLGANIGGGWGSRDVSYALDSVSAGIFPPTTGVPATSFDISGVIGGLQHGYNWQFNRNWLFGLEADFNWSGMEGSGSSGAVAVGIAPLTAPVDEHIKWFGTARARLGFLPTDNLLAYVTGGFAYGKVERSGIFFNNSNVNFAAGIQCNTGTACYAGSASGVATGWTVGGGLEYAVWPKWTVKAEYLYVRLDSESVTEVAVGPAFINANFSRTNFNVARVGVNYRF